MTRGRFKQSEGTATKRLRPMQGSETGYRMGPACHACYRMVEDGEAYCEACKASGGAKKHRAMVRRMGR